MITLNRIPSHVDSSSWRKRDKKFVPNSDEGHTPDFEELFHAVSENTEINWPRNRKPSSKQQEHPGKKSKLDLRV